MAFKETHYWDNGSGPYCGIFGHSFIRRLCARWNRRNHTDLPYSGEAHGNSGLTVDELLHLLRNRNLAKFDVCFVQIGENDMMYLTNHQLMYRLLRIINEFHRQGVRRVAFGSMFLRHDRQYNKRAKRLNKILRKLQRRYLWDHGPQLINNEVISTRDGVHLWRSEEPLLASRIAEALRFLADV